MSRIIPIIVVLAAAAAQAQSNEELERRERCAVRVSIAITGKAPSADMLASLDPQARADALLDTTDFIDRYARFVNMKWNRTPGATSEEDAPFHLAWKILQERKPWKEMFLGAYKVVKVNDQIKIEPDANGLGYFNSPAWMKRYAGNEPSGIQLSRAYRIMNNTIGLKLTPSTNAPDADISATGRSAVGCRGCHYDGMYALDLAASLLPKRMGTDAATMTFEPPATPPTVTLMGGHTMTSEREFVTTLVESESFRFNTCRMAFNYLFGRNENRCEAHAFDRCMKEFRNNGTLQSAVAAIVKDPAFCQ